MKKANIYRLIVLFVNGSIWDLQVLSVNAEAISCLLPRDEKANYIKKFSVEMIEFEAQFVDSRFVLKVMD